MWAKSYFKAPNYAPEAAEFAEIAKSPFAITEFLTLAAQLGGPVDARNYTNPILVWQLISII
jgi:hypothetical protein